jgi:hypothetical protein
VTVSCAAGDRVLGGGAETNSNEVYVYQSAPITTGGGTTFAGGTSFANATGWTASADEDGNQNANWTVSAWVVCADSSAGGGPPGP